MSKRLDELQERLDKFDRVLKALQVEWDEWYDKFRLLYARAAKRIKDAAQAEDEAPEPAQDAPGRTISPHVGYGHAPMHTPLNGGGRRNY